MEVNNYKMILMNYLQLKKLYDVDIKKSKRNNIDNVKE